MPLKTANYILRELSPDDNVSGLSLGDQQFLALKIFLRKHAKRYHLTNTAKTWVAVAAAAPNVIVGYVTLVCSQIEMGAPEDVGEYAYRDMPAVKMGRLAVDHRHRKNGIGRMLVDWAIATTTQYVMPRVGCRFLILDAKTDSIKFYERLGFVLLDTPHNKQQQNPVMFMDLGKLPV